MKANPNIDELLNGFIDGELTQKQQTEVQQMIEHDPEVSRRLEQLRRCRILIASLPRAEVPAELLERVKASLRRHSLFGEQPVASDVGGGIRNLFMRRVLATAAMIGLLAVLGVVIYTIVAPRGDTRQPIVTENGQIPTEVTFTNPELPTVSPVGFVGRIELQSRDFVAVDAFVNRAIEDNGLLDSITAQRTGNKRIYTISSSKERLNQLVVELGNIWQRFDSTTLFVETEQFGEQVMVNAVTAEQAMEVLNQDSLKNCAEAARNFAVLNTIANSMPAQTMLAVEDSETFSIPKPVLTSKEKTTVKKVIPAEEKANAELTLVLITSE